MWSSTTETVEEPIEEEEEAEEAEKKEDEEKKEVSTNLIFHNCKISCFIIPFYNDFNSDWPLN